jgi:hypothetical protein
VQDLKRFLSNDKLFCTFKIGISVTPLWFLCN